jgi:microcystin-dependent protein
VSEPFIAEVRIFAGNFPPRGYAFCDGQLLPIAQYTALFSLIGTTYGGDGRTTTALPNLQGRAPMHHGHGPGLTPRNLGARGGAETVTLTQSQLAAHTHLVSAPSAVVAAEADTTSAAGNTWGLSEDGDSFRNDHDSFMDEQAVSNTGDTQPHSNVQPYLAVNFIIALTGLYPSRS